MKIITGTALIVGAAAATLAAPGDDDFKREGSGKIRAAKNALEGKAPPALEATDWMNTNGEALDLSSLAGKVVVLDFWGTW